VDFAICVIHPGPYRGTVVLGAAHAWTAAALRVVVAGVRESRRLRCTTATGAGAKGSGGPGGAHHALDWKETRRRRVGGELGGDGVGGARGGVDAAMLRAPDLLGSMRGRAANEILGSGRYGAHRRRENKRAAQLTVEQFGAKSGEVGPGLRGKRTWGAPWMLGGAIARLCRGGGTAGWRGRGEVLCSRQGHGGG
jgi:hypothetical protein